MAHVPGIENISADRSSRVFKNPDTEWALADDTFIQICNIFQVTPQIDMFADDLILNVPLIVLGN